MTRPTRHAARLRFETLEGRQLLSLSPAAAPLAGALDGASGCCAIHADEADSGALACDEVSWDACQASSRWSSTASGSGGWAWGDATTLTWSIAPDGTAIGGLAGESAGASGFVAMMNGLYGSVAGPVSSQPWFSIVKSVFDRWAEVSGLQLVYEPADDGAAFSSSASAAPGAVGVRGDIRVGGHAIDGSNGTLAYNFYPNHGEMVVDTSDAFFANTASDSLRLRNVMAHELGHGLGLSHVAPVNHTKLMEPYASTTLDGPQHDDILGIQRLYGDSLEDGAGNDTAATATALGKIATAGRTVGSWSEGEYVSLSGATDTDYYRFSVAAGTSLSVTLTPLGLSYPCGAEGSTPTTLNTLVQNNLAVELLNARGAVVASAASAAIGASERLAGVALASGGEYFVRIRGDRDATQFYQLAITATAAAPTTGSITGTAWSDADADGIRDSGEPALAGRTVFLDANANGRLDTSETRAATDSAGRYTLSRVAPGTHRVVQVLPAGWQATSGAVRLVKVVAGGTTAIHLGSRSSGVATTVPVSTASAAVAVSDRYTLLENAPWTLLPVLANDTLPSGSGSAIAAVSLPSAGGKAQAAGIKQVAYRPATGFVGTETLRYTLRNGATAQVTITVRAAGNASVQAAAITAAIDAAIPLDGKAAQAAALLASTATHRPERAIQARALADLWPEDYFDSDPAPFLLA